MIFKVILAKRLRLERQDPEGRSAAGTPRVYGRPWRGGIAPPGWKQPDETAGPTDLTLLARSAAPPRRVAAIPGRHPRARRRGGVWPPGMGDSSERE